MELPDIPNGKMSKRRFFIKREMIRDGNAYIAGNLFRHMVRVLRLKIGTRVILTDEDGLQYTGTISGIDKCIITVTIEQTTHGDGAETRIPITLFQGLPKGNKMEFILQKGTELGVSEIIPFVAGRSIARPAREREEERLVRWRKIALEASRQSNRSEIPNIAPAIDFSQIAEVSSQSLKLLLWEKERFNGLKTVLSEMPVPESIAVMVGPEGGLTDVEAETAIANGFIPVTMGTRILRTETAAIAVLAILQFFWGDMG
jgi:16S rRNA (uracil1498-N3)-methyltransferase